MGTVTKFYTLMSFLSSPCCQVPSESSLPAPATGPGPGAVRPTAAAQLVHVLMGGVGGEQSRAERRSHATSEFTSARRQKHRKCGASKTAMRSRGPHRPRVFSEGVEVIIHFRNYST